MTQTMPLLLSIMQHTLNIGILLYDVHVSQKPTAQHGTCIKKAQRATSYNIDWWPGLHSKYFNTAVTLIQSREMTLIEQSPYKET